MAGSAGATVEGYEDLLRDLKTADKNIRLGIRKEIRQAAEPVAATAQSLAVARIRGVAEGDPWSKMRVGITQRSVYVAPRQRGRKGGRLGRTDARHRADQLFADLLMSRAMEPALYVHQDEVVADIDRMIGREAARFNRGGLA